MALCVLVKSANPRIEWHTGERRPEDVVDYLRKVVLVGDAIQRQQFYRRPGWWCGMCDYLPVCLGDEKKIKETLVQAVSASS